MAKPKRRKSATKPLWSLSLPPPQTDESPEELVLKFLRKVKVAPDPPKAAIEARLRELIEMGFEDKPEIEGILSSVRQYAIATLINARDSQAGEPMVFVTTHEPLLARALEVEARFGMRPISVEEALLMSEAGDEPDD